jgi:hypothetical protein
MRQEQVAVPEGSKATADSSGAPDASRSPDPSRGGADLVAGQPDSR